MELNSRQGDNQIVEGKPLSQVRENKNPKPVTEMRSRAWQSPRGELRNQTAEAAGSRQGGSSEADKSHSVAVAKEGTKGAGSDISEFTRFVRKEPGHDVIIRTAIEFTRESPTDPMATVDGSSAEDSSVYGLVPTRIQAANRERLRKVVLRCLDNFKSDQRSVARAAFDTLTLGCACRVIPQIGQPFGSDPSAGTLKAGPGASIELQTFLRMAGFAR